MTASGFRYTARTSQGAVVRGAMQAPDAAAVIDVLRARALVPTAVDPVGELSERLRRLLPNGRVAHGALLRFFRSFATLMRAGVPIARALNVTIDGTTDERLAEALRAVLTDIEHGASLSAAFERRPYDFAPLYVAMVRAGEAGGILDDVLDRLAVLLERETALRKRVRTALAYPAIVLVAASALIVFLIVAIVPMFATLFAGFHVPLPASTLALLEIGDLARRPPLMLGTMLLALAVAAAVWRAGATPAGAVAVDRLRLALPVVGPLVRRTVAARLARMLASLLRSGVELVGAVDAVAPVAGSTCYRLACGAIDRALRDGETFTAAVGATALFDPLFVALVRVGEETGLLDEMLFTIATSLEAEVEAAVATLGAVLEPALILILGSVVGFIVIAIFVPLYGLIGSIAP